MAGKFVVNKMKNGKDFFVLKAGNGEVILTSEAYNSNAACMNGIESVRNNCSDEKCFEVKEAKDGREYFVLKAKNHQVIGRSQMYKSTSGCQNGIASVGRSAADAEIRDDR
ncbi:MAG: YegP family protein [Xanthomonadales bacterium]|nr:YegP family protein [Xanthomonadales bacterium]